MAGLVSAVEVEEAVPPGSVYGFASALKVLQILVWVVEAEARGSASVSATAAEAAGRQAAA